MHLMKLGKLLIRIWRERFMVFGNGLPLTKTASPHRVDTNVRHVEMHLITSSDSYLRWVNGIPYRFYELCNGQCQDQIEKDAR
jgi:hypothetical protein